MNSISILVRRSSDQLRQGWKSASLKSLSNAIGTSASAGRFSYWPLPSADNASWETLIKALANVLVSFITEDLKIHLLRDLLRSHYFYFGKEERREILARADRDLERCATGRHLGFYRGSIERYLRARPGGSPVHLNLEGFYNFRMRSFQRELQQALDSAIDIHFAEKEYREFIRLLKYFLHMQQPKIELSIFPLIRGGACRSWTAASEGSTLEWEELGAADFDRGRL